MRYREYRSSDCAGLAGLFYNTVHTVNAADYTKEQLQAWACGFVDLEKWDRSFREHFTIVAEEEGIITGFGDADGGYLDRLYVHKDRQRQGIASVITDRLEAYARSCGHAVMEVHSSLTARLFFEHRGYFVKTRQQVERNGVWLTNFIMEKQL